MFRPVVASGKGLKKCHLALPQRETVVKNWVNCAQFSSFDRFGSQHP